MTNTHVTTATMTNKRTLILDEAVPHLSKQVRVTIEELPQTQISTSFLVKLQAIHKELRISGYQPRSKGKIDAEIREERNSWED